MSIQTSCKHDLVAANDSTNGYPMVYLIIVFTIKYLHSSYNFILKNAAVNIWVNIFPLFLVTPSEYTSGYEFIA